MTKVVAYIEKFDIAGTLVSRKKAQILTAEVTKNGERASATGKFKFSANTACSQGDGVKYIQDVVSVDDLRAIWNFYNSFRDEGGHDLDGTTVIDETGRFVYDMDAKVATFVNNASHTVNIVDDPIIDLSNQFDIYIYCKPYITPTSEAVLFSKTDGTTGIEIGIGAGHKVQVKINNILMSGSIVDLFDDTPHWIRVFRDEHGIIRCYVDAKLEATLPNTSNLTSTHNLIFGANYTSSNKLYTGKLAQIRVYCGGFLCDNDDFNLRNSIRQPETMKFSGSVWQGADETEDKMVYATSDLRILGDMKSNPSTQGNVIGNDTDAIQTGASILNILFKTYAPKFRYYDEGDLSLSGIPAYSGIDTLTAGLEIITLGFDNAFYINARKVVTTEQRNIDHTQIKFENGKGCKITSQGTDDTNLVNDLELLGAPLKFGDVQKFSGNNTIGQTFDLLSIGQFYGVFVRVAGVLKYESLDFSVDYSNATVQTKTQFPSGTNNVEIQIVTQDFAFNPFIIKHRDTASIARHGVHSKSFALQQVTNEAQLNDFGLTYLNRYKDVNKRITIQVPLLLNSLRPNYYIHVVNDILGIDGNFVVRTITWKYPEATTEILVGEYIFNAFDIRNQDTIKVNRNYVATPRALNADSNSNITNANTGGTEKGVGVIVKRLNPAAHTVDTTDGVSVGWCPDGVRTQFVISDKDVNTNSVVIGNVIYLVGGDNYSAKTEVNVTLINYTQGSYNGFLVKCDVAPLSNDALNYAIINPTTQQLGSGTFKYGGGFNNVDDFLYGIDWYFPNDPFQNPTLHSQHCPWNITGDVQDGFLIGKIGCHTNTGDGTHSMRVVFGVFKSGGTNSQPHTLIATSDIITVKDDGKWYEATINATIPKKTGSTDGSTWLAVMQEFKSVDTGVYLGYIDSVSSNSNYVNNNNFGFPSFNNPRYDVFTANHFMVALRYKISGITLFE